jgi:hypothetical protein
MRVCPDAEIVWTDAAICGDSRSFCNHGSGAPNCAAPKVNKVPVRGETIYAGILAHWGNHNAVRQFHAAKFERFKKVGHK